MKAICIRLMAGAACCALASQFASAGTAPATEVVLYSFGGGMDGASPQAGLIDVNGLMYGTTAIGGFRDSGTVFSVNPSTGAETVLHQFGDGNDGLNPQAGLVDGNGTLYGTTSSGGGYGNGAVFALSLNTAAEMTVYGFCAEGGGCPDGTIPRADVVDVAGTLYGTTTMGGANGQGIVFSLDPNTGAETVVHSFGLGTDGAQPYAGLINVKGTLYGTTSLGGAHGQGTIFSINLKTLTEKVRHSFVSGKDGANPNAGLLDVNGTLYGTTTDGGAFGPGSVFSFDPTTGKEKVLHSFGNGGDGAHPYAGLITVKGTLYGTTTFGDGQGTVFSIDPTTGAETIIHSFGGAGDGQNPFGGLIYENGTLYGTAANGGANGHGAVFAITGF